MQFWSRANRVALTSAVLFALLQISNAIPIVAAASEITLKPEAGNNVHLHISRYHFP